MNHITYQEESISCGFSPFPPIKHFLVTAVEFQRYTRSLVAKHVTLTFLPFAYAVESEQNSVNSVPLARFRNIFNSATSGPTIGHLRS